MSESIADAITSDLMGPDPEDTPSVPEPVTAPAPEAPIAPAVVPQPEVTPAPQAATRPAQVEPKDQTPERWMVPGYELLKEREARQKEREAREAADRRIAEYEAQRSQPQIPDAVNQPEEFQAYLTGVVEQTRLNATMTISQNFASREHGQEKVEEASKWGMEQGPQFVQWFRAQHDPFGWLMQQYQRHELAEKFGKDPDAYVRQRAAELGLINGAAPLATGQASPAQPQPSAPETSQAAVPRSLASQPSAGGVGQVVPSDEQMFDEAIKAAARPARRRGSG
jgi:hypothetical protein